MRAFGMSIVFVLQVSNVSARLLSQSCGALCRFKLVGARSKGFI